MAGEPREVPSGQISQVRGAATSLLAGVGVDRLADWRLADCSPTIGTHSHCILHRIAPINCFWMQGISLSPFIDAFANRVGRKQVFVCPLIFHGTSSDCERLRARQRPWRRRGCFPEYNSRRTRPPPRGLLQLRAVATSDNDAVGDQAYQQTSAANDTTLSSAFSVAIPTPPDM